MHIYCIFIYIYIYINVYQQHIICSGHRTILWNEEKKFANSAAFCKNIRAAESPSHNAGFSSLAFNISAQKVCGRSCKFCIYIPARGGEGVGGGVLGFGFWVSGSGFRVLGAGFWVRPPRRGLERIVRFSVSHERPSQGLHLVFLTNVTQ